MNEDQLPELSKGWATATISELVDNNGVFIDGDWVESKDQDPSGGVRLVQLADIGDGIYRNKSNRFLTLDKAIQLGCTFLKNDDVLIARMPDPLGRACLFPGDPKPCVTVVDVCIVRVSANLANNRWLMYAINSPAFRSKISSLQSGTTRKRISRGNLSKLELPLPPLPEQRAIVSKIEQLFSDLDNGIDNFKKAQTQLKRYRQSVLKAACEGKLVPIEAELARAEGRDYEPANVLLTRILKERREKWNGKGNYKEPAAPDTSGLPELLEGWAWARFDTVCNKIQDGSHFSPKIQYNTPGDGTYLYITAKNIKETGMDLSDITYVDSSFHKSIYERCNPEKGDVLLTKDGVKTGIAAINNLEEEFSLLSSVALFKSNKKILDSYYLKHFLNSPIGFKMTTGQMTGTAIKRIILDKIRTSYIPLPPLAEQRRIVAEVERRLSISDKMEATIAESLQKAESLRQSILKKAFEGKLLNEKELEEARNAPDWEPAEKLLERIRKEKAQTGEKKRKR